MLLMWVVISERVHDLKLSMHRITAKRYRIWKNKGVNEGKRCIAVFKRKGIRV